MPTKKMLFEVLGKLQEYFGKELKPEVFAMYVEHLEGIPDDKFKAASVRMLSDFDPTSAKPFPLIKDFLAMCGQDSKTRAVNVVSEVREAMLKSGQYQSVDFGDRALHSVIQRYGGWAEMVLNNTDEWWSLHERNFIAAYESARRAGVKGPERLLGLHEAENIKNGYTPEVLASMGMNPEVCGYDGKRRIQVAQPNMRRLMEPKTKYHNMTTKEKLKALTQEKGES